MLALPTATAVTSPDALTVATLVFELLHAIVRPSNTAFDASRVTAVPCVDAPTTIEDVASETLTVATGIAVTVTLACPVCPSLVAMMFALPIATAITSPEAFTVAIAVFELLQTMTRPVRMAFDASRVVAVACVVAPIAIEDAASDTVTVATGIAVTVTLA